MPIVGMYDKNDKNNINNLNVEDSFAVWFKPDDLKKLTSSDNITETDAESYYDAGVFPKYYEDDVKVFDNKVSFNNTKYVLIGKNQGNAWKDESLLSHHGDNDSKDSRLGAVVANTELWGCLITELVKGETNSESSDVKIEKNIF
ncbi:hypothetical protein GSH19_05140 [Lactobacillus sp. S2-2]|uniref:hypothetical protein n=1 Tax=Lactobacillus sp. S2-2 TaxID=2692917 RepID=UPI001F1A24CA|nr:hypothetical protein [Lactobacillus sp. S2-2]MCF6515537.1 hypothetical protein [Lactobacillus sp. S2-2]